MQVDSRAQGISLSVSVTMPRKDPLVVTEPAGLVTISGRVIESPAGTALPGARLSAGASTTQGWTMSTAEGGPDGTFRILVDPSADTVQASATGFADGQTKLHGKTSDLTIALHRKARVSGTVVEESTAKPVPGVHVLAAGPDEGGPFRRMRAFGREDVLEAGLGTTRTDASGRFTLELDAAGAVELRAIGNGWCSKGLGSAGGAGATLVEASSEAESVVTLEVARAAKVTGRVLDAEGKPAPGASARAVLQATTGGRRWSQAEAALPATAGEDGRFVLEAILPGVDVVVSAWHGDVEGPPVAVGALEPGAEREVELRLARVRKVIVTVVGAADGKPVPGATVTLNGDNDGWQEETTDATGVVTFQGASGGALKTSASPPDPSDAALGIHPFGGEATAEVPAVPDGAAALPDATVTIRLPDTATGGATAGRRALSGTVRFPDGTPAAGAKVTTEGDEEGVVVANGSRRFVGDAPSAAVGADGTFALEPSEGDPVRLRASISRLGVEWSGTVEAAPGAKGLVITVTEPKDDDPATVRVRVVDAEGKPVAAAKAQIKTTTSAGASSTSYGSEVTDGTLSLAVKSAETVEIRISDARDAMGIAPAGGVHQGRPPARRPAPRGDPSRRREDHRRTSCARRTEAPWRGFPCRPKPWWTRRARGRPCDAPAAWGGTTARSSRTGTPSRKRGPGPTGRFACVGSREPSTRSSRSHRAGTSTSRIATFGRGEGPPGSSSRCGRASRWWSGCSTPTGGRSRAHRPTPNPRPRETTTNATSRGRSAGT